MGFNPSIYPLRHASPSKTHHLEHFACWYRVYFLLGSRLGGVERIGSAGLLAGCRVDLPVHAALYTNRENALAANPPLILPDFLRASLPKFRGKEFFLQPLGSNSLSIVHRRNILHK